MEISAEPPNIRTWPIGSLVALRKEFKVDPNYQRELVWEKSDKIWLIDTIMRGLPIPLIFIHKKDGIRWIVDGQQRINTILNFIDGKIELNEKVSSDIINSLEGKRKFTDFDPDTKENIMRYPLPIVDMENFKDEKIRSVYRRLQRGKPLSVAEVLNASMGDIVPTMRELSRNDFFRNIIALRGSRYKYYQLAAIMLYFEHSGIKDIGPINIYNFFDSNSSLDRNSKEYKNVVKVLGFLTESLKTKTPELKRPAWVFTIYLLTSHLLETYVMNSQRDNFKKFICDFYSECRNASSSGDSEIVEFTIKIGKGTTSESSIKRRYQIILGKFLKKVKPQPLDENRLFSEEQKRHIFRRDNEKCTVCSKTLEWGDANTQYHHKDRWIDGGRTETDKGELVCKKCHLGVIHGSTAA